MWNSSKLGVVVTTGIEGRQRKDGLERASEEDRQELIFLFYTGLDVRTVLHSLKIVLVERVYYSELTRYSYSLLRIY
jgi:hypothetical protein